MIAYYALGGGLGHLRRAARILPDLARRLGLPPDAFLLTASPHGADARMAAGYEVVPVPRELSGQCAAFGAWLKACLRGRPVRAVVVDAFPLGILGELADASVLPDVPLVHIARLLRFGAYRATCPGTPRRYTSAFVLEDLVPEHEAFLRTHSDAVIPYPLSPPVGNQGSTAAVADALWPQEWGGDLGPGRRPLWLVVHAGPTAEVHVLLAQARRVAAQERVDPRWAVVSPNKDLALDPSIARLDRYPADPLFPQADRIVTACGFNSMLDTQPYRAKHLFVPLARRFDDQFLRGARAAALWAAGNFTGSPPSCRN